MAAAAPSHVFVYGTLMAEEVVRTLLGRMPAQSPAEIKGFRRFAIVGRQYPAIVPSPGYDVCGKVLFALSPREMRILDLFEDEEYTRQVVTALPLGPGPAHGAPSPAPSAASADADASRLPCSAGVYVWAKEARLAPELQGEWSYDAWREQHLEEYVAMCRGFPEEGEGLELRLQLERERQGP